MNGSYLDKHRWTLTSCAVVLATIIRVLAARGDLWLDEIWSIRLSEGVESPSDVIFRVHHDNNHPLNTLWFWLVGPNAHNLMYRLPAVTSGALTLLLTAFAFRRTPVVAVLVLGFSYPLIHYSSEARGYGPMTLFAVAAWLLAKQLTQLNKTKGKNLKKLGLTAAYLVTSGLGLLCHATFTFVIVGCFAGACVESLLRPRIDARTLVMLACHIMAMCLALANFLLFARHLEIGGGNEFTISTVSIATLSLCFGGPETGGMAFLLAAFTCCLLVTAIRDCFKASIADGIFYLTTIVVAPVCSVVILQPDELYQRYFLVSILFFQLSLIDRLTSRETASRRRTIVLTVFVIANAISTLQLLQLGRGSYSAAISDMANRTAGATVEVGADHDFRVGMTVEFIASKLKLPRSTNFQQSGLWTKNGPEWVIRHRTSLMEAPPDQFTIGPLAYELRQKYPHGGLSGFSWYVYQQN